LIRLVRAELLKARRRQATYVLLGLALVITVLIYAVIGRQIGGIACDIDLGDFSGSGTCLVEFPQAYGLMNQFAFSTLGGLLAIIYAAAFVGADWNWGVVRNVVARGESRARYLVAKALGLAILLFIGAMIIFVVAFVMTYVVGALSHVPVASPLRGGGIGDLVINLGLGYLVVLERAALGFAVAVVLRSQLAGAVVGIVLYVGEEIVTTFLTFATAIQHASNGGFGGGEGTGGGLGLPTFGPEWFQYLPMSIGNQVLSGAPGASSGLTNIQGLFLRPVPLEQALPVLLVYLVAAIGLAIVALNRQEIA
jgi:ABC-2 type transport system permease protein